MPIFYGLSDSNLYKISKLLIKNREFRAIYVIKIEKNKIRLFGIDAPEKKQKCTNVDGRQWDCGIAAQKALQKLVESVPQISCDLIDVDRYSRLVMRCYAGEKDVAAELVRKGLALAYRQYSTLYSRDENVAKITKAGMWGGSFTKPWTWRHTR